jgi:hypothetical protein
LLDRIQTRATRSSAVRRFADPSATWTDDRAADIFGKLMTLKADEERSRSANASNKRNVRGNTE